MLTLIRANVVGFCLLCEEEDDVLGRERGVKAFGLSGWTFELDPEDGGVEGREGFLTLCFPLPFEVSVRARRDLEWFCCRGVIVPSDPSILPSSTRALFAVKADIPDTV